MTWQPSDPPAVIAARRTALWTLAYDELGPVQLKIEADPDELWSYAAAVQCGPDGDLTSLIARDRCVCAKAPVGALIGKIGGSTAGVDDGRVFPVGSYCVVHLADGEGPLYLGINDEITGMANNDRALTVRISRRSLATPARTTAPADQQTSSGKDQSAAGRR